MEEIKLKPCPFCGGKAIYSAVGVHVDVDGDGDGGVVYCMACGSRTASAYAGVGYTTYVAAAAAWNRRVPEKEEN